MSRLAVVYNPRARGGRRRPDGLARLERVVGGLGEVRACGDLTSLERATADFRRAGVEIIAIDGGDGTASRVATACAKVYGDAARPALALLRGGTMNTIANSVGTPRGRPEALLGSLARELDAGRAPAMAERATMALGGRLGFLFGTGVLHGFLAEYYRRGAGTPTPWTALGTLAAGAASALVRGRLIRRMARRLDATVTVDGRTLPERDFLAVAAGTIEQIGLGFRPFFRAPGDRSRFHVLAMTMSAAGLVRDLPNIHAGRSIRGRHGFEGLAARVRIEARRGRLGYMVDGDLEETSGALEIIAGPRVRFVVGRARVGQEPRAHRLAVGIDGRAKV